MSALTQHRGVVLASAPHSGVFGISASGGSYTGTPISVAPPLGTRSGDQLYIYVDGTGSSVNGSTGWTQLTTGAPEHTYKTFARTADGGANDTFQVSLASTNAYLAYMVGEAGLGHTVTDGGMVGAGGGGTNPRTETTSSVTSPGSGTEHVLGVFFIGGSSTGDIPTPPAGFTLLDKRTISEGGNNVLVGLYSRSCSAGSLGTTTITATSSGGTFRGQATKFAVTA